MDRFTLSVTDDGKTVKFTIHGSVSTEAYLTAVASTLYQGANEDLKLALSSLEYIKEAIIIEDKKLIEEK